MYFSCCSFILYFLLFVLLLVSGSRKNTFFVVELQIQYIISIALRCMYFLLVPSSSKISSRYYGLFMNAPNCQNLLTLVGKLQKMIFRARRTVYDTTCFSRQGQLRERIKIHCILSLERKRKWDQWKIYLQTDRHICRHGWLTVSKPELKHIILLNFTCYVSTAINHITPLIIIISKLC